MRSSKRERQVKKPKESEDRAHAETDHLGIGCPGRVKGQGRHEGQATYLCSSFKM